MSVLDVEYYGEVRTFIPGCLRLRENRSDSEKKRSTDAHPAHFDLCDSFGEFTHPEDDGHTDSGGPVASWVQTRAEYVRIITLQLRASINSARSDCRSLCKGTFFIFNRIWTPSNCIASIYVCCCVCFDPVMQCS
jgi:hypothetical protein